MRLKLSEVRPPVCPSLLSSRSGHALGHEHTHLGGTVWTGSSVRGFSSILLASESLKNLKDVPCSHLFPSMPHRSGGRFLPPGCGHALGVLVCGCTEPCVNVDMGARACMPDYGQMCAQGCVCPAHPRQPCTGSQPPHLESPWTILLMV